jgi:hypothetical protein
LRRFVFDLGDDGRGAEYSDNKCGSSDEGLHGFLLFG